MSYSQEWNTYFSDNNLEIQFALFHYEDVSHGKDHQRVIFKYVNLTNHEVNVEFDRKVSYDGQELGDSPERHFNVTIPANGSVQYDNTHKSKTYYLFSKDNNGMIKRSLSSFDFDNINYL